MYLGRRQAGPVLIEHEEAAWQSTTTKRMKLMTMRLENAGDAACKQCKLYDRIDCVCVCVTGVRVLLVTTCDGAMGALKGVHNLPQRLTALSTLQPTGVIVTNSGSRQ